MIESQLKIKVLWIEDDLEGPKDAKVELLEQKGDIAVSIARDATEALEYLRKERPDIVLLDIMMTPSEELPQDEVKKGYETGFALLRKMRRELNLDMPVIILTAYPKKLPEQEENELKVAEFFSKPVKMEFLGNLIRQRVKGGAEDDAE
jgi:CheY-like chemotaxis protein